MSDFDPADGETPQSRGITKPTHSGGEGGNYCRVVLVEDNPDARLTLEMLLKEDGYDVVSAATGPTGLALINEAQADVAIIDIGLPGMDGYAIARAVRATPGGSDICLIALTGYGQLEDRHSAISAGFNAHLTKPVNLRELEGLLQQYLSRSIQ